MVDRRIIDEHDRQSVSDDDVAEMASAERSLLGRSLPVAALSACSLSCRFNVLGCVRGVCQEVDFTLEPFVLRPTGVGRHRSLGDLPRCTDAGCCRRRQR